MSPIRIGASIRKWRRLGVVCKFTVSSSMAKWEFRFSSCQASWWWWRKLERKYWQKNWPTCFLASLLLISQLGKNQFTFCCNTQIPRQVAKFGSNLVSGVSPPRGMPTCGRFAGKRMVLAPLPPKSSGNGDECLMSKQVSWSHSLCKVTSYPRLHIHRWALTA